MSQSPGFCPGLQSRKKGILDTCAGSRMPQSYKRSYSSRRRRHFKKIQTKESPKLLSLSGIRGGKDGKFISVYNFSVQ